MLNKVLLIGRLGSDPDLRYTKPGGVPVATFNIATDESYVDKDGNRQQKTEWHRIVVFQRSAENCANYIRKGSLVYVEGSIQSRRWQDQQGQERSITEIKAQKVLFLDRRGERPREEGDYGAPRYEASRTPPPYNRFNEGEEPQRNPHQGPYMSPEENMGPAEASRIAPNNYKSNESEWQQRTPDQGSQRVEDEDLGPAFPSEAMNNMPDHGTRQYDSRKTAQKKPNEGEWQRNSGAQMPNDEYESPAPSESGSDIDEVPF